MRVLRLAGAALLFAAAVGAAVFFLSLSNRHAYARDLDGHYAASNPDLHKWFNQLASGKGLCCSFADGVRLEDVDWDTLGKADDVNTGYRVRVEGQWIPVPKSALITEPNIAGFTEVWPYKDIAGVTQIRCFLPGAGG